MLWTLLVVVSSIGLLSSAVASASAVDASLRSYVVAALFGLVLAIANAWAWTRIGYAADDHVKSLSEVRGERYLRTLYLALAIWALCGAVFSAMITGSRLRRTPSPAPEAPPSLASETVLGRDTACRWCRLRPRAA